MYRITVTSSGLGRNVVHGERYCFTKKSAKSMIDSFLQSECTFTVEKLIRLYSDIFCFTEDDDKDKILKYYQENY